MTTPRMSGPNAEAKLKRGRERLVGLLGRGERVIAGERAVARRAVEGDRPRQVGLAHRVDGQARDPRRDDEGDVAGLEHRLGLDVGGPADALALHPGAVDRVEVGDGGAQPAGAGLHAQMAARDALVAEAEIAVGVAADDHARRGQRDRLTGVEAGDDPQLQDRRRGLGPLRGTVGRLDARALVEPDLGEREVDVAEAAVDDDAAGLRRIGQGVEQVAHRGVLASEPELQILWRACVVVEYYAHLVVAHVSAVAPTGATGGCQARTQDRIRASDH